MAKKKGRRFFVSVAPEKAAAPKADSQPKKRRRFFVPPDTPTWTPDCATRQRYNQPPREVCEDCGARARIEGGSLVSDSHGPDCFYAGWPRVIKDCRPRPSVAQEWRLGVSTCMVCRAHGVTGDVEHDRQLHQWDCTWWDAHPGVTPF